MCHGEQCTSSIHQKNLTIGDFWVGVIGSLSTFPAYIKDIYNQLLTNNSETIKTDIYKLFTTNINWVGYMYVRWHEQILIRCSHSETTRRVVIFIQTLVIDNYRLITALKPTYIEKWQQDVIICRQSLQNLYRKNGCQWF